MNGKINYQKQCYRVLLERVMNFFPEGTTRKNVKKENQKEQAD
jgi:hypothetical protein